MIEIKNLSVNYGKNKVLKNINIHIKKGKITAVIGLNASGKTTLVNCISSVVKYKGTIKIDGRDLRGVKLRERAQLVSVLHQHLPASGISVKNLVEMGRNPYVQFGRKKSDEDNTQVLLACKKAGIENLLDKSVDALSGGERQKAYVAMVLCQNTPVVLLDEPTTYMDKRNEKQFISLITGLCKKEKKTLVTVMHDITSAVNVCDEIIILDGGEVAFCGPIEECVNSGMVEKIFGVTKIESDSKIIYL